MEPNQQNQTTQIIAKSSWYEIYREMNGDVVRLVAKYVDRFDASIYSMRIVEISGDSMHMYVKWNLPESRGEKLITDVKLQPDAAAQWRERILAVASIEDLKRLMWDLDEIIINQAKE